MEQREDTLRDFGAGGEVVAELLDYNASRYALPELSGWIFPLEDEEFVPVWEGYEREVGEKGVFETLRSKLVQLNFPIREGISRTDGYRDASLRGRRVDEIPEAEGLDLEQPDRIELFLAPSAAGRLPVLLVRSRSDFADLVRALAFRNEPVAVAPSMGSLFLAGYNNWDRLTSYRVLWEKEHPEESWKDELVSIASKKEIYQDKLILLSDNPYSGVEAESLGVDKDRWKELSHEIRLGHELCHYFCKRVLLSARSNALDEILADYCGIVRAAGRFRSDWSLRFLGLEDPSAYRRGGRLENYAKDLSQPAFAVLCSLVAAAAANLEALDDRLAGNPPDPYRVVMALAAFSLEELAAARAVPRMQERYTDVGKNWRTKG